MFIKICGVKTVDVAISAVEAGADLIGFVFAKSKRQVTIEEAAHIRKHIPKHVKTVGVFVDRPIKSVNEIKQQVDLDFIQLHGNESTEDCSNSAQPVIKAISVKTRDDLNKLVDYAPVADYLLLDGPKAGSGQVFDWTLVDSMPMAREKLVLSGGLTPENVQDAISMVKPIGVDVSSGVETNGVKDVSKIEQFIKNVRKVR